MTQDKKQKAIETLTRYVNSASDTQLDELLKLIETVESTPAEQWGKLYTLNRYKQAKKALELYQATPENVPANIKQCEAFTKAVEQAITANRSEYSAVLFVRYINGLTVKETAYKMGVTERTIHNRTNKAIASLDLKQAQEIVF